MIFLIHSGFLPCKLFLRIFGFYGRLSAISAPDRTARTRGTPTPDYRPEVCPDPEKIGAKSGQIGMDQGGSGWIRVDQGGSGYHS